MQISKMILTLLITFFSLTFNVKASTLALETDVTSYFLDGYSLILSNNFENGFNIGIGTGKYTLPKFIVKDDQDNYDNLKWKAKSKNSQILRGGYRFKKPSENGIGTQLILLRQSWKISSDTLNESVNFKTLSLGLSVGYYIYLGKSLYLYPLVAIASNSRNSGSNVIQGNTYKIKDISLVYTAHLGFDF